MKRFSEQLKKKADSIKLSALERADLRERLESYMEYHPLPAEIKMKKSRGLILDATEYTAVRVDFIQIGKLVGAFAAMVLVAVPLFAERSVPGDVLYPVKVQFNEEIRSTLSLSPYAKVEWETKRLERRVAEARLLASEGKLTPEVGAEVAEAVKSHSDAAKREIATIRESDNDEAAIAEITFNSALEVQSEVLESDIKKDTDTDSEGNEVKGHSVLAIAGAVNEVRQSANAQSGEGVSYEKLMARIEIETTSAYEYFNTIESLASRAEKSDIERRLQDIDRKVDEAVILHENGEPATNFLALALADTRKLISFMTNIDVRENVTIEDLVPVTLTLEERTYNVSATLDEVIQLRKALAEVTDSLGFSVLAKVEFGFREVDTRVGVATSSLTVGEIITAETNSNEAYVLILDIAKLIEFDIANYQAEREAGEVESETDRASSTATSTIEVETEEADRATSTNRKEENN